MRMNILKVKLIINKNQQMTTKLPGLTTEYHQFRENDFWLNKMNLVQVIDDYIDHCRYCIYIKRCCII